MKALIRKIQANLTPDLLNKQWRATADFRGTGHCYVATEALYWMMGGPQSGYKPHVLSNITWPEGLAKGETHWFLAKGQSVLDPTASQFDRDIPYRKGRSNGMMNHPHGGSKRARKLIARSQYKNS